MWSVWDKRASEGFLIDSIRMNYYRLTRHESRWQHRKCVKGISWNTVNVHRRKHTSNNHPGVTAFVLLHKRRFLNDYWWFGAATMTVSCYIFTYCIKVSSEYLPMCFDWSFQNYSMVFLKSIVHVAAIEIVYRVFSMSWPNFIKHFLTINEQICESIEQTKKLNKHYHVKSWYNRLQYCREILQLVNNRICKIINWEVLNFGDSNESKLCR